MPASPAARARGFRRLAVLLVALVALALFLRLGPLAPDERRPAGATVASTPSPAPSPRAAAPRCVHGDRRAEHVRYADWARTLVDTTFRLPAEYEPPDLVSAEAAGFAGPFLVRELVIEDLAALRAAADAAGNPIELAAAHRTYEQQDALFRQRVAELGEAEARRVAARPGHSEHQLGTTVDFKTAGAEDVDLTWASTPAGAWTIRHAHEYGFVLTYPEGETDATCYRYEPWHYRYFGRERAAAIVQSGLTVREFLWRELDT